MSLILTFFAFMESLPVNFLLLPLMLMGLLIVFYREELTFEMLVLEPRASDDETLESEASIGTADSSENLNMDSEGTIFEKSDK